MANTSALSRYRELCQAASTLPLWDEARFAPLPLTRLARLWPNGLPRGTLCEIHGPRSSGRTAVYLHILAQATGRGEICALVDTNDAFDPAAAAAAGVRLERLLWVRCRGNLEHAMRAADLLLHAGGFGMVALDLCEAKPCLLNRIPLSYWHRFRRAVEHTRTVLLLCSDRPQAKSSISNKICLKSHVFHWVGRRPGLLLCGVSTSAAADNLRAEPLEIEVAA